MKWMQEQELVSTRLCTVFGVDDALLGSAAIGAGGNIFSSIFGSSAAKQQADAIKAAAETARKTAIELDDKARADMQPFRDLGLKAGNTLSDLLLGGKSVEEFLRASPMFNFQSEIGSRDINRQLVARGLYGSGAGLETLSRFENQLVAQEGQNTFDRLFNLTGLGSNAASRMATGTTATGNNVAQLLTQAGINQGQAIGDAGRSLAMIGPGMTQPLQSAVNSQIQYDFYRPFFQQMSNSGGGMSMPGVGVGTPFPDGDYTFFG